jgi:hypothetical protein
MSGNMFAQYLKERLLEGKQIPARANDPPKKPTTRDKIEPLGSQRVEHENRHPRITWLKHFVMSISTCAITSRRIG